MQNIIFEPWPRPEAPPRGVPVDARFARAAKQSKPPRETWNCKVLAGSTATRGILIIDAGCIGKADGKVTINASGGTGSFSYSTIDSTNVLSNVFASTGSITVTDEQGCTIDIPYQVLDGLEPCECDQYVLLLNGNNTACGDSSGINVKAEVLPQDLSSSAYSYTWTKFNDDNWRQYFGHT